MKSCLECGNWWFNPGCSDYSDVTPGEDWELNCNKGHFRMSGFDITQEEFREKLLLANKCEDFKQFKKN